LSPALRSNAGMANRQGSVDLRFAQFSAPQLELWLGSWSSFNSSRRKRPVRNNQGRRIRFRGTGWTQGAIVARSSKEYLSLYNKASKFSATIQSGVMSFDDLTLQYEGEGLYSLRAACLGSTPRNTFPLADNQPAELLATSTRCCHLSALIAQTHYTFRSSRRLPQSETG
jgi:hypothetical protein